MSLAISVLIDVELRRHTSSLQFCNWYPLVVNVEELRLHADTQDTLSSIIPVYHTQFLTLILQFPLILPPYVYLLQCINVR